MQYIKLYILTTCSGLYNDTAQYEAYEHETYVSARAQGYMCCKGKKVTRTIKSDFKARAQDIYIGDKTAGHNYKETRRLVHHITSFVKGVGVDSDEWRARDSPLYALHSDVCKQ